MRISSFDWIDNRKPIADKSKWANRLVRVIDPFRIRSVHSAPWPLNSAIVIVDVNEKTSQHNWILNRNRCLRARVLNYNEMEKKIGFWFDLQRNSSGNSLANNANNLSFNWILFAIKWPATIAQCRRWVKIEPLKNKSRNKMNTESKSTAVTNEMRWMCAFRDGPLPAMCCRPVCRLRL